MTEFEKIFAIVGSTRLAKELLNKGLTAKYLIENNLYTL